MKEIIILLDKWNNVVMLTSTFNNFLILAAIFLTAIILLYLSKKVSFKWTIFLLSLPIIAIIIFLILVIRFTGIGGVECKYMKKWNYKKHHYKTKNSEVENKIKEIKNHDENEWNLLIEIPAKFI